MTRFSRSPREIGIVSRAEGRQEWWAGIGATGAVCGLAVAGWLILSDPVDVGDLSASVVPAADAATFFTFAPGQSGAKPIFVTDDQSPLPSGDIIKIQTKLKSLGFDPGTADGKGGPRTLKALNAYRKSLGLAETTAVDRQAVAPLMP